LERQLAAEVARLREDRDTARAALKDICDEWSGANGATCNPTCSSYGHDADCKATSIAAHLAALTASAAAARKDSERWRAFVARAEVSVNEDGDPCIYAMLDMDDVSQRWADALQDGAIEGAVNVQSFWDDWGSSTDAAKEAAT
jgi:hypothetical protein